MENYRSGPMNHLLTYSIVTVINMAGIFQNLTFTVAEDSTSGLDMMFRMLLP